MLCMLFQPIVFAAAVSVGLSKPAIRNLELYHARSTAGNRSWPAFSVNHPAAQASEGPSILCHLRYFRNPLGFVLRALWDTAGRFLTCHSASL